MQGQLLAMHANDMSTKSRREGVSMHVITIWTLIFLPGTFVAVSNTPVIARQIVPTNPRFFADFFQ